ncbi:MAG: permease [Haloarculaceae archaeon]
MSERGVFPVQLDAWYRRTFGEPTDERDIYLGFGLFFAGIGLGLVGLVLYLFEGVVGGPDPVFWLREIAFAAGALGLPTLLVGVVVLLPVDRRALLAAPAGLAVCLLAVAYFVSVYPYQWNVAGADHSAQGVMLYAVGMVLVLAATGTALVTYQIERVAPATREATDETESDEEEVTDEQVRRDIEAAMEGTDITWGGVKKDDTRRIEINADYVDEVDRSSFDQVDATETRSSGQSVDDAVANLKGLKGGEERTERSEGGVDDQAAALQQLREQQRAQADQEAEQGLLARVRERLGI